MLLVGVQIVVQRSFTPVIIETDYLVLVSAIGDGSLDNSELGFLLNDLREGLSLISAQVQFVRRSANMVAHVLANEPEKVAFIQL